MTTPAQPDPATQPSAATISVTEYTINAFPRAVRIQDRRTWNVYARHVRDDRWIVTTGHEYYDADGQPHGTAHEAGNHLRADAIDLATRVATTMRVMGRTAAERAEDVRRARAERIAGGAS